MGDSGDPNVSYIFKLVRLKRDIIPPFPARNFSFSRISIEICKDEPLGGSDFPSLLRGQGLVGRRVVWWWVGGVAELSKVQNSEFRGAAFSTS